MNRDLNDQPVAGPLFPAGPVAAAVRPEVPIEQKFAEWQRAELHLDMTDDTLRAVACRAVYPRPDGGAR